MNADETLIALTADIVAAHLTNNPVATEEVAGVIKSVHDALAALGKPVEPMDEHVGAVSVRKSLRSPDHIISMIDGKPYRTLKRHLAANGLTPAQYRERYKLPADYPMTAPTYSALRREGAVRMGLRRKPKTAKPMIEAKPERKVRAKKGAERGSPAAPREDSGA